MSWHFDTGMHKGTLHASLTVVINPVLIQNYFDNNILPTSCLKWKLLQLTNIPEFDPELKKKWEETVIQTLHFTTAHQGAKTCRSICISIKKKSDALIFCLTPTSGTYPALKHTPYVCLHSNLCKGNASFDSLK